MLRRLCPITLALLISYSCISQQYQPDSSTGNLAIQNAINLYHNYLSPENGLYNGSEYAYNQYYPFRISEGHPFLFTQLFTEGTVLYDNIVYHAPLLLDIVHGELLIRVPSNIYCKLNSERIEWFKLQNYTFIHLRPDSTNHAHVHNGFYAILSYGTATLYKEFLKTFKDDPTPSNTIYYRSVVEKDNYFIVKGSKYFRIRNKKTLLGVLIDKKKEVQRFMRSNKIKIRKNKETAFTRIANFYNSVSIKK